MSKYRQGNRMALPEAVSAIENRQFIYVRGKIYHYGWAQNWILKEIISNVNKWIVRRDIKNEST